MPIAIEIVCTPYFLHAALKLLAIERLLRVILPRHEENMTHT